MLPQRPVLHLNPSLTSPTTEMNISVQGHTLLTLTASLKKEPLVLQLSAQGLSLTLLEPIYFHIAQLRSAWLVVLGVILSH